MFTVFLEKMFTKDLASERKLSVGSYVQNCFEANELEEIEENVNVRDHVSADSSGIFNASAESPG